MLNPDYALDFRSLTEHRKEPSSVNILKILKNLKDFGSLFGLMRNLG